ncbi:MAG: hypothetical protein ACRDJ4_03965 [Actinomycetota bacterium]
MTTKSKKESRFGRSVQFTTPAYAVRAISPHVPALLPARRSMSRATRA